NLGTGEGVEVRRLAQSLARLVGKKGLVEEKMPPEIDPAGHVVADIKKLKQLGWQPAHNLEAGLEKLVGSFGTAGGSLS
ncbi:MAG TPA: hypothetical protein VN794_08630, partial [Methylomirabilota bacterium]|nr:hypothetical protein [Methylomirabilota bacterium]